METDLVRAYCEQLYFRFDRHHESLAVYVERDHRRAAANRVALDAINRCVIATEHYCDIWTNPWSTYPTEKYEAYRDIEPGDADDSVKKASSDAAPTADGARRAYATAVERSIATYLDTERVTKTMRHLVRAATDAFVHRLNPNATEVGFTAEWLASGRHTIAAAPEAPHHALVLPRTLNASEALARHFALPLAMRYFGTAIAAQLLQRGPTSDAAGAAMSTRDRAKALLRFDAEGVPIWPLEDAFNAPSVKNHYKPHFHAMYKQMHPIAAAAAAFAMFERVCWFVRGLALEQVPPEKRFTTRSTVGQSYMGRIMHAVVRACSLFITALPLDALLILYGTLFDGLNVRYTDVGAFLAVEHLVGKGSLRMT